MMALPELVEWPQERVYSVACSMKNKTITFLEKYCSTPEARRIQRRK